MLSTFREQSLDYQWDEKLNGLAGQKRSCVIAEEILGGVALGTGMLAGRLGVNQSYGKHVQLPRNKSLGPLLSPLGGTSACTPQHC